MAASASPAVESWFRTKSSRSFSPHDESGATLELMAMNFDERIERLTERHEALTQSVELLVIEAKATSDNIRKLVEMSNRDAIDIQALVRIAERHERRISDIE